MMGKTAHDGEDGLGISQLGFRAIVHKYAHCTDTCATIRQCIMHCLYEDE